jgi:endoglycosylceramidase
LLIAISTASIFKINKDSQMFVDNFNRERLFHGVNVVYKLAPFYPPIRDRFHPSESFSEIDMQNLQSWGLNVIRLHVAFEGVEPVKGQYNQTYLDQIMQIVKQC